MTRIERTTSPLPRECSTTELHGRMFGVFLKITNVKPLTQALRCFGAGEGNRTLVISLEGFCSTIELHPRRLRLSLISPIKTKRCTLRFRENPHRRAGGKDASCDLVRIGWWRGLDSNQRTHRGQIYSLLPLTTRPPLHAEEPGIMRYLRVLVKPLRRRVENLGRCIQLFYIPLS